MVSSTAAAGTISHISRGLSSLVTRSCSDVLPVAFSCTSSFTAFGVLLNTTQRCPPLRSLRTMLAPILPSPIIPSCIALSFPAVFRVCPQVCPQIRHRSPVADDETRFIQDVQHQIRESFSFLRKVKGVIHNSLGLGDYGAQVRVVLEAFRINLVDVFRSRRSRGKPAIAGYHLQPANRRIVSRSSRQFGGDRLSGKSGSGYRLRRQFPQLGLLLGCCRSVDARVIGCAEFRCQFLIMLARIFLRTRGDFRRQQIHDETVFVGGPRGAVEAQEARPGAFFTAETTRSIKQPGDEPLES